MLGRARSMLSTALTVALTFGLFPTMGLAEAIEEVNSAGALDLPSVEQPAADEPAIAEQEGQTQKETLGSTTDGDSSEIEVEDTSAIEPTPDENPAAEVNLTTQGDDEEGTVQGVIGTALYTWDGSTLVVGAGEFSQVDWVTETEQYKQSATSVTFEEGAKLTDSAYEMFFEWNKLVSVDASNLDTSSVTNMYRMFNSCSSLETIDVSNLSTSQVATMEGMFALCGRLGSIDLSGWDTSNVTSMRSMFNQCTSLKLLDLSQFVTFNVTTMYHMFYKDANLVTILVGEGWNTTNIGPGTEMFSGCTSLAGGAGTAYDANHVDGLYARVDGGEENPGYLTDVSDTKPTFQSAALVLNGTINLRFFMKLSALTDEERQSGYMSFTAGGRERPNATFDPNVRSIDGIGYLADGTALGVTKLAGGKWRVALTGIPAHQLGNQWNISIDAGGNDRATVEVSALAYANAAMASDAYKNDEHACGSMTALWHYYQATLAYRAAHPQA